MKAAKLFEGEKRTSEKGKRVVEKDREREKADLLSAQ